MATRNEVDLIIRAKNYGMKSVKQLGDDLKKVAASQREVSTSQKLAQTSTKQLAAEQEQLLAIMKSLDSRAAGLSTFQKQRDQLIALEQQLASARGRFADLTQQFFGMEKPSKEFVGQLRQADAAVNDLARQLQRAHKDIQLTSQRLADGGVDVSKFELAQREVNDALTDAIRLYKQAEDNAEKYGAAVAAAKQKAAGESFRAQGQRALDAIPKRPVGGTAAPTAVSQNAAAIDALVQPAKAATASVDALEKELDQLGDELKEIPAGVEGSKQSLEQLTDAAQRFRNVTKGLSAKAGLIDDLRQQEAALTAVRAEYDRNVATVRAYANAVARADAPNEQLAASLKDAQQALTASDAALRRQQQSFDLVSQKADRAGINIRDLAGEEQRLNAIATTTAAGQKRVAAAIDATGNAIERTEQRTKSLGNSQRTALSLYQRTRGQVLSLTASYVGLFGVMQGVGSAIDVVVSNERILSRLSVGTGNDMKLAAEEFDFVRRKADELGLEFESLAESYSRFFVGARQAGQDVEVVRYIFESFSEAAASLRLSGDDTAGVFRALEQIFSKGFIQAEELRGQLGDRMTGAFKIFADGIGVTTKQLNDLLEAGGKVTSEMVLLAAQTTKGIFSESAKKNAAGLSGQINVMKNAIRDFKAAIMEGPFKEELAKLINRTTAFFKSNEGAEFAKNLGITFAAAAEGIQKLIEWFAKFQTSGSTAFKIVAGLARNMDVVVGVFLTGNAVQFLVWLAKLRSGLIAATGAQVAFNAATGAGTVAATGVAGRAIGLLLSGPIATLLGIAATAIVISVVIRRSIETEEGAIRKAALSADEKQDKLFRRNINLRRESAKVQTEYVKDVQASTRAVNAEIAALTKRNAALAKKKESFVVGSSYGAGAAGAGGTAGTGAAIRQATAAIDREQAETQARIDSLTKNRDYLIRTAEATAKALPKIYAEEAKNGGDALERALAEARANADKFGSEDDKKKKEKKKKEEDFSDDRIRLAEQTADKIADIENDILRAQDDTLENRLKLLDSEIMQRVAELEKLKQEAAKLGMAEEAARLDAAIARLGTLRTMQQAKTTKDFNAETVAKNEQAITDALQRRATVLDTINTLQEAGAITQEEAQKRIIELNATMIPQLDQLAASAEAFIETLSGEAKERALVALNQLKAQIVAVRAETNKAVSEAAAFFTNHFVNAFGQMATLMAEVIKGTEEGEDAFRKFGDIVLNTIADILIELGKMILYQAIYNALKNAAENSGGGAWGSILNTAADYFGKKHTGGVVGRGSSYAKVNPLVFAGATRYHTGGVAGLAPDEVPTILRMNEEVLTEDDPRHRFNGGTDMSGASMPQEVNIVNQFDSGSVVSAGLATAAGKRAIFNVIKDNSNSLRKLLAN